MSFARFKLILLSDKDELNSGSIKQRFPNVSIISTLSAHFPK